MATRMLQRRGTAAQWAALDPVLAEGEFGVDITNHQIRVGDGVTPWSGLPDYVGPKGDKGDPGNPGAPGAPGVTGPTGSIVAWAGSNPPPADWLYCHGQVVSRTTYAALLAVIGTQFGIGDGSTTFNLPDLRGKAVVGLDTTQTEFNTMGKTGGEKTHLMVAGEMPAHNHGGNTGNVGSTHTHNAPINYLADVTTTGVGTRVSNINNSTGGGGTAGNAIIPGTNSPHTHDISSAGGGTAHNNLQPYIALEYIIKT